MNNYYKQKARWEILNKKREERKLAKKYNEIIKEIFRNDDKGTQSSCQEASFKSD